MKKHIITKLLGSVGSALLIALLPAQAAGIMWGSAQNITGDSDVSTAGAPVYAFDLGLAPGTSTVVNDVAFASAFRSGSQNGVEGKISFAGEPTFNSTVFANTSALSGNYKFILQSAVYRTDANGGTFTITLQGLTVGAEYQIQVWSNDSRDNANAKTGGTTFSTSGGNSVSLEFNTTDVAGGLGQFALGSFVASATTQEITLTSITSTGGSAQINALQLRKIADAPNIPEPGTYALILGSCAIIGFVTLRRFR